MTKKYTDDLGYARDMTLFTAERRAVVLSVEQKKLKAIQSLPDFRNSPKNDKDHFYENGDGGRVAYGSYPISLC